MYPGLATKSFLTLEIRNVSWAPNQHIIIISEGSCDTADWSNDAENITLPSLEEHILYNTIVIFHSIGFTFGENKKHISKTFNKKILPTPNCWPIV